MNPRNFFSELKRRNVYKVAIAYGVVAWLLLQAASILFPTFEAPTWTMKVFVAMTALGFPIALIIAWAFELTPEGLKRTEFADELPKKSARSRVWIYVVIIASAMSVSLFFLGRYTATSKQSGSAELPAKSISILPFANLSRDPDNAYFAAGIQDEIVTRLAKIAELGTDVTQTNTVMGSPAYLSPEQASGQTKNLTTAADVYSLGAVLYELLTGRPPFQGESALEIMQQVVGREPISPRVIQSHIDRDVETICLKCLEKDPAQRYGSAEALADDWERWLRHEPILARPSNA